MTIHCKYDELVDRKALKPHPKNHNKHPEDQIARLSKLIKYQGIRAPIVVSKLSGCIVKGHGTSEALWLAGETKAPVVYQDFASEEQEYAFVQSDNAIASWADLDLSGINADIGDLGPDFDIDLLGIKDFEIEVADKFQGDEDAVPGTPKEAITRLGDLYELGGHRLLCGDATKKEDVERLMNGEKADMVFTDPPYGIAVENTKGSIEGDQDLEVFKKCLPLLKLFSISGAHYYVWCAPGSRLPESIWEFAKHIPFQNLLPVRCTHENKRGPRGAFKYNYEVCLFGNDNTRGFEPCDKVSVTESTLSDKRYTGDGFLKVYPALWDANRATEHNMNIVHPTQKKVEMIEFYLQVSAGRLILDLFLGSGSTLIACEKTGRKCYGMEIDPLYCDVIIKRWEDYTGRKAEKIGTAEN